MGRTRGRRAFSLTFVRLNNSIFFTPGGEPFQKVSLYVVRSYAPKIDSTNRKGKNRMDTVIAKTRLIGLGVINDAFDWAIDSIFDLTVLRQKGRDLDKVIKRVNLIQDGVNARVNDLNKWLKSARRHAKELDRDITTILKDGDESNDSDAVLLQAELTPLLEEIEKRDGKLQEAIKSRDENQEMLDFLALRLKQVTDKVRELTETKQETKTLEEAATAVESTEDVLKETDGFQNIGARILEKNGRARQRYERVTASVQELSGKDSTLAAARAKIAARKEGLTK